MSPAKAKQTVLVSTVALMAISLYRVKTEEGALYKRLWGTGVIGLFLAVMADFAPSVAGPFAALVVLGSLTNGGDAALQNLLGGAAAKTTTTTTGPPGTTGPQVPTTTTNTGGAK